MYMPTVHEYKIECNMGDYDYYTDRGTGMIASSTTFCPHPGRVITDLFRQLHAV